MRISAIRTTGIYCRPGCPARPLERNRTRYLSAVAAEAAGYRACLRCRPDREPEVLPPVASSADVSRALRALCDGRGGAVPAVGAAEFEAAVGASASDVAAARRARFARRLLEQTDLSLGTIATAAGFSSAVELDAQVGARFAFDAEVVRQHRRAAERDAAGQLGSTIAWTEPFWLPNDIDGTFGYLASRGIPGVVSVVGGRYRRMIRTSAGVAVAEVAAAGQLNDDVGQLAVRIDAANAPAGQGELLAISAAVRRLFALDARSAGDLPIAADRVLGPFVVSDPGRRLAGAWDRFETAVRIIIGQQVTVAAASTLTGRVVDRCSGPVPPLPRRLGTCGRDLVAPFPSPAALAAADLADIGMPGSRSATITRFAAAVADGSIDLAATAPLDECVAMLCEVKGIGPWTAQLIAARVFGDPDAFPPKDLGLRRAYEAMGGDEPVEVAAERWRPHRAAAIAYLWSWA